MNNSEIDVVITIAAGTILLSLFLVFVIIFVIVYRKKQEEFEWEKQRVKQLLLKTEIEIKEQTLSNISRELHDNLGQVASLIKINLSMLDSSSKNDSKEVIKNSLGLTKQLITDIKSLSTTLKGENLSRFGLYEMIKKDVERLNKMSKVKFVLRGKQKIPKLKNELDVFLYRMSQEIFNNVLQHSHATEAELNISASKEKLFFNFKDNGKGFDLNTYKMGNGLINLEERCKIINAELKISSIVDTGTQIQIVLNLKEDEK